MSFPDGQKKKPHSQCAVRRSEMPVQEGKTERLKEIYALPSLRRIAPAKPTRPVPSSIMLLGSGTGL